MKILLWLVLAVVLVAQQPDPERYPGQSEHREPPVGWMCEPQNYTLSVPPDHVCSCERMCDDSTGQVIEDKQCQTWCHPTHCRCQTANKQACK